MDKFFEIEVKVTPPDPEPVAWMDVDSEGNRLTVRQWSDGNSEEVPLYMAPRKPLNEDQMNEAYRHIWRNLPEGFGHTASEWIEVAIRYAERVHGIIATEVNGDKDGSQG